MMLTRKFNSFFCCHRKLLKSTFRKKNPICLLTTNIFNETNNVKDSDSLPNSLLLLIEDHKIDNPQELSKIEENAKRRGCKSDVKNLYSMWEKFKNTSDNENNKNVILKQIHKELLLLPNTTCLNCEDLVEPKVIGTFGKKRDFFDALTLEQLSHHGVQTTMTGNFTGRRSYYLRGSMAQLEAKLVRYAIQELQKEGFAVMSVPDIVHEDVLSSCGVPLESDRTLVYRLDAASVGGDPQACLSGTAEMALGGWLRNRNFNVSELPLRLCSVSRCFRAEANSTHDEHGIFRVHNFTKVEMFGVTANETGRESEELYQELVALQQRLLEGLGLHGQVVLMPPFELGKPAHCKTDMEVWLPGRRRYAELTSASNCLAYQAARLGATYTDRSNRRKLVHTVNGTALAVPRCIIALCETHQEEGGRRAIRMPRRLGLTALQQSRQGNEVGDEQLEKIMVYKEQCVRKVLPSRHLELLIQE